MYPERIKNKVNQQNQNTSKTSDNTPVTVLRENNSTEKIPVDTVVKPIENNKLNIFGKNILKGHSAII